MAETQPFLTRIRDGRLLPGDADEFVARIVAVTGEENVEPIARRAISGSADAALALWQIYRRRIPKLDPATDPARQLCARLLEDAENNP